MHCPHCNQPVWRTRSGISYCLSIPFCTYRGLMEQQQDEVIDHMWSVTTLWRAIGHDPKAAMHGGWRLLTEREKRFHLAECRHIETPRRQSVFDALKRH